MEGMAPMVEDEVEQADRNRANWVATEYGDFSASSDEMMMMMKREVGDSDMRERQTQSDWRWLAKRQAPPSTEARPLGLF